MQPKADAADFLGRFREIVSDPLNLLINRHPLSGTVHGEFVYLHNGNKVALSGPYAYYGGFSDILVINRGVHEPLEEYVFQEMLRVLPKSPAMLELGAYWGHYSMWLKKVRPESSVYLIEPDTSNIQAGQYNFLQNNYQGEFIQEFVGQGQFEVDTFLKARKLASLDVLHADIQGYEIEMLNGSSEALNKKLISYIFVSTHSQSLHADVINLLGLFGYRVEVAANFDSDTTSYDGFVFASSPLVEALFEHFKPLGREQISKSQPIDTVHVLQETLNATRVKP